LISKKAGINSFCLWFWYLCSFYHRDSGLFYWRLWHFVSGSCWSSRSHHAI